MPLGKIEPFVNPEAYKKEEKKIQPVNKSKKSDNRSKKSTAGNAGQKVDIKA